MKLHSSCLFGKSVGSLFKLWRDSRILRSSAWHMQYMLVQRWGWRRILADKRNSRRAGSEQRHHWGLQERSQDLSGRIRACCLPCISRFVNYNVYGAVLWCIALIYVAFHTAFLSPYSNTVMTLMLSSVQLVNSWPLHGNHEFTTCEWTAYFSDISNCVIMTSSLFMLYNWHSYF